VFARSPHLPYETLADLVEGRLAAGAAVEARAHVAGCARCGREVATLERMIGALRAGTGEDAPPVAIARAVRLFAPFARPAGPGLRERLVAMLAFDSGARPLTVGLRAASIVPRQLLYQAGEHTIDCQLTPAGERWVLAGQILGPGVARGVALVGPDATEEAPVSEQGEFTLPPVAPGRHTLRVTLDAAEIEVPDLAIGT
jgi:anti-sigma factor RsiW